MLGAGNWAVGRMQQGKKLSVWAEFCVRKAAL